MAAAQPDEGTSSGSGEAEAGEATSEDWSDESSGLDSIVEALANRLVEAGFDGEEYSDWVWSKGEIWEEISERQKEEVETQAQNDWNELTDWVRSKGEIWNDLSNEHQEEVNAQL